MAYFHDPEPVPTGVTTSRTERDTASDRDWRKYDFSMDCLIPAEDYALPKGHKSNRD